MTSSFHVVRYSPEVPMDRRPHAPTVGRFPTWLAAEEHRLAQDNQDDLQVEQRTEKAR